MHSSRVPLGKEVEALVGAFSPPTTEEFQFKSEVRYEFLHGE